MNKIEKLAELRRFLAPGALPDMRPPVALGHAAADAVLEGGLRPGLHEVFAAGWCAGGFAAGLAIRCAGGRPLFWIRPDYEALEYGAISASGLLELGGDPSGLMLLCAPNAAGALSAASDILSCPHVGTLLLEIGGMPRCLDLVASRRLALAASEAGLALILLRAGAEPEPSAALTRWQVRTAPSRLDDDDWGNPRWQAQLTRHRLGGLGDFFMQWDCDHGLFRDAAQAEHAPHPGAVVCAIADRPAAAPRSPAGAEAFRRAAYR
jgi:protein ImuA